MDDDKLSQESICGSESNFAEPKIDDNASPPDTAQKKSRRRDQGRLHAVRDSVLSRGLLGDPDASTAKIRGKLRRLEAGVASRLRPQGVLGRLFFDRCFAMRAAADPARTPRGRKG